MSLPLARPTVPPQHHPDWLQWHLACWAATGFVFTRCCVCLCLPHLHPTLPDFGGTTLCCPAAGSTTAAAGNSFTSGPEAAEGTSTPTAIPEPLQSHAAVPAATKLQNHTGDSPAQPLPAPSAVRAPAAAPAAMAAPGTQPAAQPAAFVATSGATHEDELSAAAEHPMQHSPSLCTDPEGSGGAKSEPPATSEEEVSEGSGCQPLLLSAAHGCPARQSGLQWLPPLAESLSNGHSLCIVLPSTVDAALPAAQSQPATPSHSCSKCCHALLQCRLGHAWSSIACNIVSAMHGVALIWPMCLPQDQLQL